MRRTPASEVGAFNLRTLFASCLCLTGILLAVFSVSARAPKPNPDLVPPATAAVTPTPTWTVVPSPNNGPPRQPPEEGLNAIACISASDCWAVGNRATPNFFSVTLIEHWNGTDWSVVSSPNADANQQNNLSAVTCNSTSDCWAVGLYGTSLNHTLIEHWNGTAWSVVSSPNTSQTLGNYLTGIACMSPMDCWAVGSAFNTGSTTQTLIERWNGSSWAIVSSPNTSSTMSNGLSAVTCSSSSNCIAVGNYNTGTFSQTLAVKWNGTFWFIIPPNNTSATQDNILTGVTCLSSSNCTAVGVFNNGTVYQTSIQTWNGSAWSTIASPNSNSTESNILLSVSCLSATECSAAGYYIAGGTTSQTLLEHWNGASWSIVSTPNTSGSLTNQFSGIACLSPTQCFAAGLADHGAGTDQTLIEQLNGGSWIIAITPNFNDIGSAPHNSLSTITCNSAMDCWAVGQYTTPTNVAQTSIEYWDGNSWTLVSSPNTSTSLDNSVVSVACASKSQCWAVGFRDSGAGITQTLIQHWDGISWSIVPSPNSSPTQLNSLDGVTCTSSSDCWAIGAYLNGSVQQTLFVHWNGAAWSIVSSPNTSPTQTNIPAGIACPSANNCWVSGFYNNGTVDQTLIEHWDGSSWSIVGSPNTSSAQNNDLNRMTCTSSSNCWAVGSHSTASANQTLVLHWNGTSWSIISSPSTSPTQQNALVAVACVSNSDCSAVGEYNPGVQQTLIEQWNGTTWSIIPSPNIDPMHSSDFSSVACPPGGDCMTVGEYSGTPVGTTLIARRTLPALQVTMVTRPSAGHFVVTGSAVPMSTVNIQATTDLSIPFMNPPIGTTTAAANGVFQYDDGTASGTKKFYRATYP